MILRFLLLATYLILVLPLTAVGQQEIAAQQDDTKVHQRPDSKLEYRKWSGDLNIPDPVSISFDAQGRAFVTQTARRKIQDLDIRQNRDWIPNDLSFETVQDKIDFYHNALKPTDQGGDSDENQKHVEDANGDGTHDYRDLMVISERIHLVEDVDSDGTADRISLFAEDFKTEVTGIAAGVLAHDGWVYATIAPDVWKLRDTNNDGRADFREKLATGFGFHIAYAGHDMHGLTVGPDGKIYWSVGDKGISATSREGKRFHFPNQGGVMRCNPDGSEFEVFAHGLRNVQELAFDQFGNLFGFDNDSDQSQERERFINIVYGMDAGWRCNYQYRGSDYNPWMAERMWQPFNDRQPAHIVPPIANSINGPCGFAFNPGTALSSDYKDYFFLTGTIQGEQIAFKILSDGDAFKMTNEHKIGAGIPLIGINFSPGGALVGVDWGGGYPLNQTGAIWEIDVAESLRSPNRKETARQLSANYENKSAEQLSVLLSNPDQRVRLKAQFALVRRNEGVSFQRVATSTHSNEAELLSRIHAIWGLGQLARKPSVNFKSSLSILYSLISDEDPQVRMQVARTLGDTPQADGRQLIPLLADPSVQVRLHAALSIGRLGTREAFDDLVQMAATVKPPETYLRHAVSIGLAGIESRQIESAISKGPGDAQVSPDNLQQLASHENKMVRLIGAVALRRLSNDFGNHPNVKFDLQEYLNDEDQQVATEIARAIYDDFSIDSGKSDLAAALSNDTIGDEAFIRRAIGANFRLGRYVDLERVARFASDPKYDTKMRLEAINAIENWQAPNVLDRVTGRFRGSKETGGRNGKRAMDLAICKVELFKALDSDSSVIQSAALKTLRSLNIVLPRDRLVKIFNSDLEVNLRIEALNSLVEQSADMVNDSQVRLLLIKAFDSKVPALRTRSLQLLADFDPDKATDQIEQLLLVDLAKRKKHRINRSDLGTFQSALLLLGRIGTEESDRVLQSVLDLFVDQTEKMPEEIRLEALEAAGLRSHENQVIDQLIQRHEAHRETTEIGDFAECRMGGDPARGKTVFNTHVEAQCVRCHRVGKQGSTVGPNMDGVAARQPAVGDADYLLRSIVAPSAHIDKKYQTIMFLLESGKSVQGVVVRESEDVIVLADTTGEEIVVNVDEIEFEKTQKLSIMPVAKTLTKREIRDLVAYLATLNKKNN